MRTYPHANYGHRYEGVSSSIPTIKTSMQIHFNTPTLQNHYWAYCLGFALILIEPMFMSITTNTVRNLCLLIGYLVLAALSLIESRGRISTSRVFTVWLIVSLYLIFNHALSSNHVHNRSVPLIFATVAVVSCSTHTTRWVKPALDVLLVMCMIHAIMTVFFLVFPDIYTGVFKPRFFPDLASARDYRSGISNDYGVNGMYLAIGTIIAASHLFRLEDDKRKWLPLLALFTFALILTSKRSHFLVAVFSISVCYLMGNTRGKVFRYVVLAAGFTLVFILLSSTVPEIDQSFSRLFGTLASTDLDEATSGRTFLWEEALRGFQNKPLEGNGWGTFFYLWPNQRISTMAHNELLETLYSLGIVGATVLIALELICLVVSFRVARLVLTTSGFSAGDRVAVSFGFTMQLFNIVYSYTTGIMLERAYVFVPYFIAMGVSYSYLYLLRQQELWPLYRNRVNRKSRETSFA